MLEPDAPGLKESKHSLKRDDSIEWTQYQRDMIPDSLNESRIGISFN